MKTDLKTLCLWALAICVTPYEAQAARPQIAVGYINLALKSDGTVWAWGNSCASTQAKQLKGNDGQAINKIKSVTTTYLYNALLVKDDGTAIRSQGCGGPWRRVSDDRGSVVDHIVQASGSHSTALLKSDGSVWNFGDNDYGQLGQGSAGQASDVALRVKTGPNSFLTGVKAVLVGPIYSIAVKRDGSLWAWGFYNGRPGYYYARPLLDKAGLPITNIDSVAEGGTGDSVYAIKNDGSAWVISIGSGDVHPLLFPDLRPVSDARSIAGNSMFGCNTAVAVDSAGNVGQVICSPRGAEDNAAEPPGVNSHHVMRVKASSSAGQGYLTDVNAVASKLYVGLALKNDSSVWQWGGNSIINKEDAVASPVMEEGGLPLRLVVTPPGSCYAP